MICPACDKTSARLVDSPELGERACELCADKARVLALRRELRSANQAIDFNLESIKHAAANAAVAKLGATLDATPVGRALLDFVEGRAARLRRERER